MCWHWDGIVSVHNGELLMHRGFMVLVSRLLLNVNNGVLTLNVCLYICCTQTAVTSSHRSLSKPTKPLTVGQFEICVDVISPDGTKHHRENIHFNNIISIMHQYYTFRNCLALVLFVFLVFFFWHWILSLAFHKANKRIELFKEIY